MFMEQQLQKTNFNVEDIIFTGPPFNMVLFSRIYRPNIDLLFIEARPSIIMSKFPTVMVPAYDFQFNLIVYPLPDSAVKTVSLFYVYIK